MKRPAKLHRLIPSWHSFASRLTRWIMLTLLVTIAAIAGIISVAFLASPFQSGHTQRKRIADGRAGGYLDDAVGAVTII